MNDDIQADRLFLIGPMGSGKTTVGRQLARLLEMDFLDLDLELQKRCGVDVATIFEIEGEAGFRRREAALLDELTQRSGLLLATGGGSILMAENRRRLQERGLVVHLQTTVDQQMSRLAQDQKRPLLQTPDRRQRLEQLAAERDPLYAATAHLTIASDLVAPAVMARRAASLIRPHLHLEAGNS